MFPSLPVFAGRRLRRAGKEICLNKSHCLGECQSSAVSLDTI